MQLTTCDHLEAAEGWLGLGDHLAANVELENITPQLSGVLNVLSDFRSRFEGTFADAQKAGREWGQVVSAITQYARGDPLERLQIIGKEPVLFLYDIPSRRSAITLRPGVAYCFRKHYGLVADLVKGAWARYVRRFNLDLLGESADLHEFLFGSERTSLTVMVPVLNEIQEGSTASTEQIAGGGIRPFVQRGVGRLDLL